MRHRQGCVDLQPGDEAATCGIEFGPPAIVVVAEVEDIGRPRADRHGLGDGDVVDVGRCQLGKTRTLMVRTIDDMQLDPAHTGAKLRPIGAQRVQPEARGVNQIHRICHLAGEAAFAAAHQLRQQPRKDGARALGVGISQGRARQLPRSEMIEPCGMALERSLDRTQALGVRKLRKQHRHELVLRAEPPHPLVGLIPVHKPVQDTPWHQLQKAVKYCIVVAHGGVFLACLEHLAMLKTAEESTPCALSTKFKPDSRGLDPGIHDLLLCGDKDVDGRDKPGHDGE